MDRYISKSPVSRTGLRNNTSSKNTLPTRNIVAVAVDVAIVQVDVVMVADAIGLRRPVVVAVETGTTQPDTFTLTHALSSGLPSCEVRPCVTPRLAGRGVGRSSFVARFCTTVAIQTIAHRPHCCAIQSL